MSAACIDSDRSIVSTMSMPCTSVASRAWMLCGPISAQRQQQHAHHARAGQERLEPDARALGQRCQSRARATPAAAGGGGVAGSRARAAPASRRRAEHAASGRSKRKLRAVERHLVDAARSARSTSSRERGQQQASRGAGAALWACASCAGASRVAASTRRVAAAGRCGLRGVARSAASRLRALRLGELHEVLRLGEQQIDLVLVRFDLGELHQVAAARETARPLA